MIYTITPNPTLDLGGIVEKLIPNEKTYVHDETRFPGGNGINAARIIHKFGCPVVAGGFLGGGIGQEVKRLLDQEGVRSQFVKICENTRIGITVSDRWTHLQTRLSFAGPKIRVKEARALIHWAKKIAPPSLVVIGGSLPVGFSHSYLKQMIKEFKKNQILCVVDIPGMILKDLIKSKPFLIKPNLIEFQEMIGKKVESIQDVTKEGMKLNSKVPLICVSSVEGGALLITQQGTWFGRIPSVKIRSTVGAGDSMVGAMSVQILKKSLNGEHLLKWGLAAATATLTTPGTMLGQYKDILRYYPKVRIKKLG